MKKLLTLVGSMFLLTGCSTNPHAQLSSEISQVATDKPQVMHFKANGVLNGINIFENESGSELEIETPGTYFIIFSPQIISIDRAKPGCFEAWLVVSGKPVADSGVKECFNADHPGNIKHGAHSMGAMSSMPMHKEQFLVTDVLTGQAVQNFNHGDRITVHFRGQNTKTSATPSMGGVPSIPSSIISITKVS